MTGGGAAGKIQNKLSEGAAEVIRLGFGEPAALTSLGDSPQWWVLPFAFPRPFGLPRNLSLSIGMHLARFGSGLKMFLGSCAGALIITHGCRLMLLLSQGVFGLQGSLIAHLQMRDEIFI